MIVLAQVIVLIVDKNDRHLPECAARPDTGKSTTTCLILVSGTKYSIASTTGTKKAYLGRNRSSLSGSSPISSSRTIVPGFDICCTNGFSDHSDVVVIVLTEERGSEIADEKRSVFAKVGFF